MPFLSDAFLNRCSLHSEGGTVHKDKDFVSSARLNVFFLGMNESGMQLNFY